MANLTGFNIGANQRGILNIGSTINTPLDTTLRAVTDGLGNASPLQLSTTLLQLGSLFVNGDILRVGNNDNKSITISNSNFINYSNFSHHAFLTWSGSAYSEVMRITGNGSVGNVVIGTTSASARLHVRGDGTNPIARFETSAGSPSQVFRENSTIEIGSQGVYVSTTANGVGASNSGRGFLFVGVAGQSIHQFNFSAAQNSETSGTLGGINLTSTYSAASGTALYQPLRIAYTINNTGAVTGTATGIFLNATETALNGMTHNLMDLQRGGVSQFSVTRDGALISAGGTSVFPVARMGFINDPTNAVSVFSFANTTGATTFGGSIFRFNLATNAAPALKRNGAGLEVRLADDSAFANLSCAALTNAGEITLRRSDNSEVMSYFNAPNALDFGSSLVRVRFQSQTVAINSVPDASAALTIASTTRGFLPPRMTEAQRLAIAGGTPAIGLMVYQTDASDGLYVYKAGGWTLII